MAHSLVTKSLRLACVGTYPPRRCGIGTFTYDLCDSISAALADSRSTEVVAIDDTPAGYNYSDRVRFEIRQEDLGSYRLAADFMNIRGIDLLLVQHEYGIYGGRDGGHLLTLFHEARMPIVTTLHTVLPEPSTHLRQLTRELVRLSDRVVVMSHRAEQLLHQTYDAPDGKVGVIPHGIPDLPFVEPNFFKDQFGMEQHLVILTFGLLSPGKGIEFVIRALPQIVREHPEVIYIVLGATHPRVQRLQGEEYRHGLQRLAEDLGVLDHVHFENRYVDLEELGEFLGAADIYVTPYLGREQMTSGTLAYALGAGKAVVSTPYSYAEEMLADGRGRLVPFQDSDAIGREITWLLKNEHERLTMRKKAYLFTRQMVWRQVGRAYLKLLHGVMDQRLRFPRILPRSPLQAPALQLAVPELNLNYLRALSDDTGVLQHGHYTIADRQHGYCTDDNARALMVALQAHRQTALDETLQMARTCMSFLYHAYNRRKGRFRNFLSYDRRWLEEVGSDDCHARALWALGFAVAWAPSNSLRATAVELFKEAIEEASQLTAPRAMAFTLIGVHAYLRCYNGDAHVRRIREELALKLFEAFRANSSDDWVWPEDTLNYANARLPHALLLSGQWLERGDMTEMGLRCLDWLIRVQTDGDGVFSPVGNQGWFPRGGRKARFDQQPVEAHAMLEACIEARNLTGDERWALEARRCFNWFLGKNDLGQPVYDYQTGGCRDGLHVEGVSENEGAESTLAWLLSLLAIKSLKPIKEELPNTPGKPDK